MKCTRVIAAVASSLVLVFAAPVHAGDEHKEHGAGHDHATEKSHFEKKSFASPKEAWAFITQQVGEVEKHVATKDVAPVHEIGEQLDDALHTVESGAGAVPAEAKDKVAAVLKQLETAADELHHAAEDKNADSTGLALAKFKGLLPVVESLFPAGVLK